MLNSVQKTNLNFFTSDFIIASSLTVQVVMVTYCVQLQEQS